MSYYLKHILLCTNQKPPGKVCCANSGGDIFFDHLKTRLNALGLHGPGRIRVSRTGCLGRCGLGPGLVIYPAGVWYTYTSLADIDAIIEQDLVGGTPVQRLLMAD